MLRGIAGFVAAVVLGGTAWASTRPAGIPGTYRACLREGVCRVVELREDGTFLYTPLDEWVKWPPLNGRWEVLENGLLLANSVEQPSQAELVAERKRGVKKISFCVAADLTRVPLLDAGVSFSADGVSAFVKTDAAGCVQVPRYPGVSEIEVTHCDYQTASYVLQPSDANVFRIRLRRKEPHVTNEKGNVPSSVESRQRFRPIPTRPVPSCPACSC